MREAGALLVLAWRERVTTTILSPEAMMAIQSRLTVGLFERRYMALGLFFSCEITFGLWGNDDEILPWYVAQYTSHYQSYLQE